MYHFDVVPQLTSAELLQGIILGAIGALVATMFVVIFRLIGKTDLSFKARVNYSSFSVDI